MSHANHYSGRTDEGYDCHCDENSDDYKCPRCGSVDFTTGKGELCQRCEYQVKNNIPFTGVRLTGSSMEPPVKERKVTREDLEW